MVSRSATLGLSRMLPADPAALGLCVGQLASAPGAHPSKVSGVGSQLEFQLWAPSPLIWVRASWASGESWGCFSTVTVQGLRGEGRQRPLLLWRVL